jgi:16S rRNA (adenine1518-N6/adenine1519-N6)-dimethyltransferase
MAFDSSSLPPLSQVVKDFGLLSDKTHAKKLGQNFLFDVSLMQKIVRGAGSCDGCYVLEVGPGPGGLTRCLLETQAIHVFAIERDPQCIKALQGLQALSEGRLTLVQADAVRASIKTLVPPDKPLKIVANLPYNVGTELLVQWLQDTQQVSSLTLMFQKEVGQRIVAPVNTEHYGRLSILAQYTCVATLLFHIPPSAFTPPPKVYSSVVHLVPKQLSDEQRALLPFIETVTRAAFGQRRKMLRSSLKSLGLPEGTLAAVLETSGILETQRAETVSVDQFAMVAKALQKLA